jgi:hypothetical protein
MTLSIERDGEARLEEEERRVSWCATFSMDMNG